MAKDAERLATLAREYIGADVRRLPDGIIIEIVNSVIDSIGSVPVSWNEKIFSYYTDDRYLWAGEDAVPGDGSVVSSDVRYDEGYIRDGASISDVTGAPASYIPYDTAPLPIDIKEPIALFRLDSSGNRIFLSPLNRDEQFEYFSASSNDASSLSAATPTYWTISGDTIVLSPFPDAVYRVHFWYYAKPTEVTSLTQYHPMIVRNWPLVLYGVLLESARYLNEDDLIPLYERKFEELKRKFYVEETRKHHAARPVGSKMSGGYIGGIE